VDPVPTKKVQPRVPVGASGRVRVEVTISSFGKVTRVRVLDPTPYADAVRLAAEQCEFRPAMRRGKKVAVQHQLTFELQTNK
jgi:TonB family protein